MDDQTYRKLNFVVNYISYCMAVFLGFLRQRRHRKLLFLCRGLKYLGCTVDRRSGRIWMYRRTGNYWEGDVAKYNNSQWIENFRMTKETFLQLLDFVYDDIKPDDITVREPISAEKRLAIAVYTLASSAEYRTVAHNFGVSKSSVCNCFKRFCISINKKLDSFIYIPKESEAKEIAQRVKQNHHFPQVMGCIDGSHIPITAPVHGKRDYTNRKGWDSLILQALVDDHYIFRDVNISMPGSVHDATVFKESGLFKHCNKLPKAPVMFNDIEVPLLILGDPAYPLLPWLIKPYIGFNLSQEKESFNCYHSSVRICVENAFGRLKGRWRILGKKMDVNINLAPAVIATCCALHNLCERNNIPLPNVTDQQFISRYPQPYTQPPSQSELLTAGADVRHAITAYLLENQPLRTTSRFM